MLILKLDKNNQKDIIRIAIKVLKQGNVVIFPTDTIYGILADATDKKAVEKIFTIKKRSKKKFLPIFIKDLKDAKKLAKINKKQEKFLKLVWPGKTTVVLEQKRKLKLYGIDKKTIALRISDYAPLNELLRLVKVPLVQTSANLSGNGNSKDIDSILKQFRKEKPVLAISDGVIEKKPSTIIDLTVEPPTILR